MPNRSWAERVDDELARRGVPARSRRRLMAELRDHADDLTDGEGLTMTDDVLIARVGEPTVLAARAAEDYRRARWSSRHPLLAFGLLPLPATVLAFAATVLAFGVAANVGAWLTVGDTDLLPRPAMVALAYGLAWGVRFVPFVLLAVLFTRLYVRGRVSRWWFAAAGAQVLTVAGSLVSAIQFRDDPGQSTWTLGVAWLPVPLHDGWALPFLSLVGWAQVAQVAVPLGVGALMVRAARRRQAVLAVPC
ncbi:hypothetical protein [Limnoglobus roseus]|uniref:Uncharacterized protein n=1 Tax=Limnoglobus roseus TaxID=2598579 RepID=A0A5C1AUJ1_9BACT|nr:hypothetical protein [Limnoglobus roseus]QEL20448.1 hypothetical protein PX52LOC_07546 [Limnoglobus roseus]